MSWFKRGVLTVCVVVAAIVAGQAVVTCVESVAHRNVLNALFNLWIAGLLGGWAFHRWHDRDWTTEGT